jgi:hypothetical protein
LSGAPWRATWSYLTQRVVDDEKSNRFEVASEINAELGQHAPFWGRPASRALANLSPRKEVSYRGPAALSGLAEWREVERVIRDRGAQPQPVWKLCNTGSVGSQTLLGIPVVDRLRNHDALRDVSHVWPFEVFVPNLPAASTAVVHAEIWPSIVRSATRRASAPMNVRSERSSGKDGNWIERTGSPSGSLPQRTTKPPATKKVGFSASARQASSRLSLDRSGHATR